ncbi:rhodanese-like domain-containing protein [Thermaerobacter litoralis]
MAMRAPWPDTITPEELRRRLEAGNTPLIIDVREPDEYAGGHIPGARLLPLSQVPVRYRELPADQEMVLVCRSGNRSGLAQRWLQGMGFRNVRNLVGGMQRWKGPVEYGPGRGR